MRLSRDHNLSIPIQSNISLDRFAMMGATDPEIACEVYNALWTELTSASQEGEGLARPPVVFTIDSIAHVMRDSAYMSPDVTPIHAHDLTIVNHFFRLLSGKATLPNGGMVLATDSGSNRPTIPGFDHAVARNAAIAKGQQAPQWDPWVKVDQRSIDVLNGVDEQRRGSQYHGVLCQERYVASNRQ
jgi:small subunit ribosomal protein S29